MCYSATVELDEALAIAAEIGEALGGRQQRALEVLCRAARRGARPSQTFPGVAEPPSVSAAEHFRRAAEELDTAKHRKP